MNTINKLVLCMAALFPVAANALNYTSTFTDNGNITTETRLYNAGLKSGLTEVWEWLDLTITNGFSYNDIAADLADDSRLNHSVASLANPNQVNDLLSLSPAEQIGWAYASIDEVANQYSAFFNLNISPINLYEFGSNVPSVERYIGLFGDTFHEGADDISDVYSDVNPSLANIGYTRGLTGTQNNDSFRYIGRVFDGQYIYESSDISSDWIDTNLITSSQGRYSSLGSYLTRQASTTQVSEPATVSLFALALVGLVTLRRKFVK